jgi:hypothetical protein
MSKLVYLFTTQPIRMTLLSYDDRIYIHPCVQTYVCIGWLGWRLRKAFILVTPRTPLDNTRKLLTWVWYSHTDKQLLFTCPSLVLAVIFLMHVLRFLVPEITVLACVAMYVGDVSVLMQ